MLCDSKIKALKSGSLEISKTENHLIAVVSFS